MMNEPYKSSVDGGRIAARGFRYQYLRTLESLLSLVEDPGVACVRVEGPPGQEGYIDAVDFDVLDGEGRCRLAVQVKSKAPGGSVSASDAFAILIQLIAGQDASSYQLLTNGVPTPNAQQLVEVLTAHVNPTDLRNELAKILATAPRRLAQLQALQPVQLNRLTRCRVLFDHRDDVEILEALRENLRAHRNQARSGLGQRSAGLLTGYLVSEIFRQASDDSDAEFTIEQLRSHLLIDAEDLARVSGSRDWGVIVGPMPSVPDVARPALLGRLVEALTGDRPDGVRRAALVGLSGVGKSSLAADYIADRADFYDWIFWVDGETTHSLLESFRRITRFLRPGEPVGSYRASAAQVRDDVHADLARLVGRWMLVFDNVNNQRQVESWIPRAGRGDVITTSIDSTARHGAATVINIGVMDESEAVELLRQRLRLDDNDCRRYAKELNRLAESLSRWPLALELASGYLDACGIGLNDVDYYLERLKVRSLTDPDSLPPGYPRTLAAALSLCLEQLQHRINQSGGQDYRPCLAFGVITYAAFLAARQIPIHMVAAAVLGEPETDVGPGPAYLDPSGFNLGEVIRELRCFSIVSFDDDLPPTGGEFPTDANRTITTNAIIQDLIRVSIEHDDKTLRALNSLANHVARWLTAMDLNLFERVSVIFNHADTLAGHINRLNIRGEYIPLLYGNLSGAYRLRGDPSKAEELLHAELNLIEDSAEPNELLAIQAKLSLVDISFEDPCPTSISPAEALSYLADAFQYAVRISANPLSAVKMAVQVKDLARRPPALAANLLRFSQLEQKCAQLVTQLGPTPFFQAVDAVQKASDLVREGRLPADAERLSRQALESNWLLGPIELEARRILVEALVQQHKWQAARDSLNYFRQYFGSTGFGLQIVARFVHNVGCFCTISVLEECNQDALKLLSDILDWPIVSEALMQPSSGWSPRLRLLGAVRDLGNKYYQRAEITLKAIRPVDLCEGTPEETKAWCFLWQMARLATFRAAVRVYICGDD